MSTPMPHPLEADPRLQEARRLRAQGLSLLELAERFGVSKPTIVRWTTPGALERGRQQSVAWKLAHRGTCKLCDGPTQWENASGVCLSCMKWTREEVIESFDRWFAEHHRSPRVVDAIAVPAGTLPRETTVAGLFGNWNGGLLAAGLPLNLDRQRSTTERMAKMVEGGATFEDVGRAFGCTGSNVRLRMVCAGLYVVTPRDNHLEVWARIADLWRQGCGAREIAAEIGRSRNSINNTIQRMRRQGWDLPYRRADKAA